MFVLRCQCTSPSHFCKDQCYKVVAPCEAALYFRTRYSIEITSDILHVMNYDELSSVLMSIKVSN